MNSLTDLYETCVLDVLGSMTRVNEDIINFTRSSVCNVLDSLMIIAPPNRFAKFEHDAGPSKFEISASARAELQAVTDNIAREGLQIHFPFLMQGLSNFIRDLFLSPEQREALGSWASQGATVSFMMTDVGGPNPRSWRTTFDGKTGTLNVNKQWIMVGPAANCGIVVAHAPGSLAPVRALLSIEDCEKLTFKPNGLPFLDGTVQLASIIGQVQISEWQVITQGGPGAASMQLFILRPFFVRGVIAHLRWLARSDRLVLSGRSQSILAALEEAASKMAQHTQMSSGRAKQALALKFLNNQFLIQLASERAFRYAQDERDALGFAKMEGSSYRCLFELIERSRSR